MRYRSDSVEGRLLAGDEGALGEVNRWIATVIATPRFLPLRDEHGDLRQEILLAAIRSLREGRFDPERDFRKYVQGTARSVLSRALDRRLRMGRPGEFVESDHPSPDPEPELLSREVARQVLDTASEACRALLLACYLQGKSQQEVAADQGVPVGTIKSRLFRCLRRLSDELSATRVRRGLPSPGGRS